MVNSTKQTIRVKRLEKRSQRRRGHLAREWNLKGRTRGPRGHLSLESCRELVVVDGRSVDSAVRSGVLRIRTVWGPRTVIDVDIGVLKQVLYKHSLFLVAYNMPSFYSYQSDKSRHGAEVVPAISFIQG